MVVEKWAGMVMTSRSQCFQWVATKPRQNKIMVEGEPQRENSKQVLKTIFYLNRFTSQRANKTWGSQKLFHSNLFSLTICSEESDLPFHTERLPPKILATITSDSASEFHWQLVLNDNRALISGFYTKNHHSPPDINDSFNLHTCICNLKKRTTFPSLDQDNQV